MPVSISSYSNSLRERRRFSATPGGPIPTPRTPRSRPATTACARCWPRATLRLRLSIQAPGALSYPFAHFDETFADREREADEFYGALLPSSLSADAASVVRQGYGGLLWTKQAYVYDVERWLGERGVRR